MSHSESLGRWLKQRRKILGLTQKELARQVDCAEITIRRIEADDLHPSAQLVTALATCLRVAPTDLPGVVEAALGIGDRPLPPLHWRKTQLPHNLPAELTPLIDRVHEMAALHKKIMDDGTRLLTLVGPPGVGKTRLALAVAADVLDHFEDGVFFVDLAPISDPAQVAFTIAQTVNMPVTGPNPVELQLRAYLEEKHLLLVLDNFEQVIAAAPQVVDLLQRCPWLHVLVTSRQPLRVRAERQVTVHPLALPPETILGTPGPTLTADDSLQYPAIALFVERAQAVKPDFALTDGTTAAVTALCRRLDGLPLGIQLIAARIRMFPPQALLARLMGPLLLSSDGLRDVEPRQKTLRGALDWSFNLLAPAVQALFICLAVFVGGFTLEAAEAVCGDTTAGPCSGRHSMTATCVVDGITALLDGSLLVSQIGADNQPRYVMLNTVREYALERLAATGEEPGVRSRHLNWCMKVAELAAPAPFAIFEQVGWQQLDAEIHNLRTALDWAFQFDDSVALQLVQTTSRYLANRGFTLEARSWIDRALAVDHVPQVPLTRATLLYDRGTAEFLADDVAAAEVTLTESLSLSRELGLAAGQAAALHYLGRLAAMAGDVPCAEARLEEAAAIYRKTGDIIELCNVISVLGEIAMFRGDLPRSRSLHAQALAYNLPPDQRRHVIWSAGGLTEVALVEGDFGQARQLAEEFLALCRDRGNPGEIAWALTCLGETEIRQGNFGAAHQHLDEALALGKEVDTRWRVPIVRADLGDLAMAEGEYDKALRLYAESLPDLRPRGIYDQPPGSLRLAYLAERSGRHELATILLSACHAAVDTGAIVFFPLTRADFERMLANCQAALACCAFEQAWVKGKTLSTTAAVDYGLQALQAGIPCS